jgi:hypothetical protein
MSEDAVKHDPAARHLRIVDVHPQASVISQK